MNSRRVSPFAALTGDEKQIKWLEYQSIRLPYVQGSVDPCPEIVPPESLHTPPPAVPDAEKPAAPTAAPRVLKPSAGQNAVQKPPAPDIRPSPAPAPPPAGSVTYRLDYQKPQHRQYDAVIARMKQAEQQTKPYQPLA